MVLEPVEQRLWLTDPRKPRVYNLNPAHPLVAKLSLQNGRFVAEKTLQYMEFALNNGQEFMITFDPKVRTPERLNLPPSHAPLAKLAVLHPQQEKLRRSREADAFNLRIDDQRRAWEIALVLTQHVDRAYAFFANHAHVVGHAADRFKDSSKVEI